MLTTLFGFWILGLIFLGYAGWGLGRLLAPAALRPAQPLLAPFLGYALSAVGAYTLLWAGVALETGRWIILAAATIINLAAWRQRRTARQGARLDWADIGIAGVGALGAGIVGVLPLFFHGLLAPIGNSWDVEFYLPLATYLRDFPYAQLGAAPPNPLIPTIQADPTYARAIGFAYVQGMIDSFGGWESLRTFSPMLGLMRLLAAPAVFLFARHGLRLNRGGAALALAFVALNELLLWVEYTGFAMHASSMPLVPIALLLLILALRELRWGPTLAAALALSGLAASYHPALLGYGALAAGAGLWLLWQGRARWRAVIAHGASVIALAGAATALIQIRAPRAFFGVYEQGAAALGTPGFISARTLLGLTPLASAERPSPPPWGAGLAAIWPGAIWAAYGLALAAGIWWLLRGRGERGLALAMLALAGVYALGLRYVVAYPYGHMKGLSFISFVPLAVIAGGLGDLAGRPPAEADRPARRQTGARRALAAGASGLLLLVIGATAWDSFSLVRHAPGLYGRERLELFALREFVPAGATVQISGAPGVRGPTVGLLAYVLRANPLIGKTQTGYQIYNALQPGAAADYAVLGIDEDPSAWGFGGPALWRNAVVALYAAPPGRLAHLSGATDAYQPAGGRALGQPTALEVVRLGISPYRDLAEPVAIAVGPASLAFGASADGSQGGAPISRTLALQVAAPAATALRIEGGGLARTIALTPGVTLLRLPIDAPADIRLASDGPAALRWAELYAAEAAIAEPPATQLVSALVEPNAHGARIALAAPPPEPPSPLRMALEIYEDSGEPRHYARALLPLSPGVFDLDLAGRTLAWNGSAAPAEWAQPGDGRYFAALWIYQGETLVGRLPLLTFAERDGAIEAVAASDTRDLIVGLPEPAERRDLAVDELATLLGTAWRAARPGATAQLSVWWRAADLAGDARPLQVTAQLLDDADRKWAQWDGALGGATPSAGWRPGEVIRQDIPLRLDPATPAGRYRLLIGVYDPADGARLSLRGHDGGASDSLVIAIEIAADQ